MSGIKVVQVSEVREHISEYFVEAVHKARPLAITRYGRETAYLLGDAVLKVLLDSIETGRADAERGAKEVTPEPDGSLTVFLPALDLVTNAPDEQEAITDLILQAKEYADEYLSNVEVYSRDPERLAHFPVLLRIAISQNDEEIRRLLGL